MDVTTIRSEYGAVTIHPTSVAVSAEEGQLYAWSHRTGASWPCSTLARFETLCAWFGSDGLLELQGFDPLHTPDVYDTEDIDSSEFNAWSSDVLRDILPPDHPAYPVAVGQFS